MRKVRAFSKHALGLTTSVFDSIVVCVHDGGVAMLKTVVLKLGWAFVFSAWLLLGGAEEAKADLYFEVGDGQYFVLPTGLVVAVAIAIALFVIVVASQMASSGSDSESAVRKSPQEYDQEAAELRAQKRHLEAKMEFELAAAELEATRRFISEQKKK